MKKLSTFKAAGLINLLSFTFTLTITIPVALFIFCVTTVQAQTWQSVPIRTQAQLTASESGGEGFQQITCMAIGSSSPNTMYFCSDTSSVWKSTDGGVTWIPKSKGIVPAGGISIAIDPTDASKVYLASIMGSNFPSAGNQHGIWRTTDGGDTWSLVKAANYNKSFGVVGGIGFAFTTTGTIYAGTHQIGLLKSVDGGATFSSVLTSGGSTILNGSRITDIKINPTDDTKLFACVKGDNFYRISDVGGSATATIITLPTSPVLDPMAAAIDPTNANIIYLTCVQNGVYKTTNGGTSWNAVNNGLTSALSAGKQAKFIAISPVDSNYLFVGFDKNKIFYTQNAGAAWVEPISMDETVGGDDGWIAGSLVGQNSDPKANYWFNPMAVHPTDKNIAFTSGQGSNIRKTTDGGINWRYSGTGYTGGLAGINITKTAMSNVSFDSSNYNKFARFLVDNGVFLTEDGGSTFRNLRIPRYLSAQSTIGGAICPNSNTIITAVGDWVTRKIAITRNADVTNPTWDLLNGTEKNYTYYFFAFHPTNSNIAYADRYRFDNIQTDNTYGTLTKSVVAMYSGNGDIVYAYEVAVAGESSRIAKSIDKGDTWTTPYQNIPKLWTSTDIGQIAIDPNDQDKIYVAVRGAGIYTVTPSTITLKACPSSKFSTIDSLFFAVDPGTTNVWYTGYYKDSQGNSNGIYRSTDAGNTWINLMPDFDAEISAAYLTVKPDDRYVYFSSWHGTWKLPPPGGDAGGTPGTAPSVISGTATVVTVTTATLNGIVNPNGSATTYRWQYNSGSQSWGTSTATGSQTLSAGTVSVDVYQAVTGLTGSITYFARIQANNFHGSTSGSQTTFDTSQKLSLNVSMGTPTVNGSLSDWTAITNPIAVVISGILTSANGSWSAKWNNSGLHLAFVGSDTTNNVDSGNNTHLDDGFELYVDRDNNEGTSYDAYDFHLGWNRHGTFTRAFNGTTTGIIIGTSSASGGYILEVTVPWAAFPGGSVPGSGTTIGADVQFNDDSNGGNTREGAMGWNAVSGVDTDYFNTETFGKFVLFGTGSVDGGETGTSSISNIANTLALWKYDESSGSSTVDSVGTHTGTYTGMNHTPSPFGQNNRGISKGNNNDLVNFGSTTAYSDYSQITGSVSVSVFTNFKVDRIGGIVRNIVSKWDTNSQRQFSLAYGTAGYLRFSLSHNGVAETNAIANASPFATGTTHCLGATYDGSNIRLYIDGVLDDSAVTAYTSGLFTGTEIIRVGNDGDGLYSVGVFDNTRIITRSISQSEVDSINAIPVAITGSASSITVSSAILAGSASANGTSNTNGYFRWGTVAGVYTGTSTEVQVGTVTGTVSVSRTLSSLSPSTTYYYAVVAYNEANLSVGTESSFATIAGATLAGTMTINSNGTYTTSTAVTLNLTAVDDVGVNGYFVSGSSTTPYATQTGWVAIATSTSYSENVPYNLSSGDGIETLYVWYKDDVSNISGSSSASIILDMFYPSISITSPSTTYTDNTGRAALGTIDSTVAITGSSSDTNGIGTVTISNSATTTVNTATGTQSFTYNARILPILDDGLVFYAKLDDATGTTQIKDSSRYASHGTNTGSVVGTTSIFGDARYFDGVDDYVNFGDPADGHLDFGTSSFSYGFWYNSETISANNGYLMAKLYVTQGYAIYARSVDQSIRSYINFGAVNSNISIGIIDPNTWGHGFVTVDSSAYPAGSTTVRVFLNGVQTGTNTNCGTGSVSSDTNLFLGNDTVAQFSKDYLDEVRIYNRTLSSAEVLQLYQLTTPDQANIFSVTAQDNAGNQGTDTVSIGAFPAGQTDYATNVTFRSASLNGTASANNNTSTVWFEYGVASGYYTGSSTTGTVTGSANTAVNIAVGALASNTTVYYRLVGSNTVGIINGEEFNLTTIGGVLASGTYTAADMKYPGSTRFNIFLNLNVAYHGLFWARNAGTQDGIDLRADPNLKLTNFRDNQ